MRKQLLVGSHWVSYRSRKIPLSLYPQRPTSIKPTASPLIYEPMLCETKHARGTPQHKAFTSTLQATRSRLFESHTRLAMNDDGDMKNEYLSRACSCCADGVWNELLQYQNWGL